MELNKKLNKKLNNVLENKVQEILNRISTIYGTTKCMGTIRNYAAYLALKKQGKIKVGTYNILIENSSEMQISRSMINGICSLLNENNVINTSYRYLSMDEIRNRNQKRQEKNKKDKNNEEIQSSNKEEIKEDLLVIDTEELDTSLDFLKFDIKELVKKFPEKVFIVITKKTRGRFIRFNDEYDDGYLGDILTWKFAVEGLTRDNKKDYIEKYMLKNNIKIDRKSSFKEELAQESYGKIKEELINIVIECKVKNINNITDKVVKDELKRKYYKNTNLEKSGLEELNSLIGIDSVKKQVEQIISYIKLNKDKNRTMPMLNMCFMGNPGTGKTTVARIIGRIFTEMEILSKDKIFVEAACQDLIGEYVGHTAPKTKAVTDKANGGVLFIDEAYSLSPKNHQNLFGDECIATLLKEMEDKRDSLCVILAGYTNEMEDLLKVNPGFESRIQFKIQFPDYTEEELYQIFKLMVKKEKYKLGRNVKSILIPYFEKEKQKENFSNARCVRNLLKK